MALEPNALTTLATVKEELSITGAADDAYLERLINSASDQIEAYCGRSFFNEASRVDTVVGYGTRRLIAPKTPINSITKIEFTDTEGNLTLVESDTYEIEDADAGFIRGDGDWKWSVPINQEITQVPRVGEERPAFRLTYDAGYVTPEQGGSRTLPFDLEDACIQLVTDRFRARGRDPSIKSEKLMSWAASYGNGGVGQAAGLPSRVVQILNRHAFLEAA